MNDVTLNIKNMELKDYTTLSKDQRLSLLPYEFEERISIMVDNGYTVERAFEYAKAVYLEQMKAKNEKY